MRGSANGGGILKESIAVDANVRISIRDREGRLLREERVHNLVVTAGKNLIRDLLNGDAPAPLSHFAVGSGSAIVLASDVTLQDEVYRDALTSKDKTSGKLTISYYLDVDHANGYNLQEAAIFNAALDGTMYARSMRCLDHNIL